MSEETIEQKKTEEGAPEDASAGSSRRRSRRSGTRKPKKDQTPHGLVVLAVVIAIGIFLSIQSGTIGLFWFTGIAFGFILRRSGFCFTASMRDPLLTGSTSLARAVLIAFAITSVGFAAIQYGAFLKDLPIPGAGFVVPISFATVAGGIIFGIGMVLAGGCASGTLMRIGEGFGMQMLSIIFFVIGSFWAARDMGWWTLNFISNGPRIHMPELFGWGGAIAVQLAIIALLYVAADKWENREQNS